MATELRFTRIGGNHSPMPMDVSPYVDIVNLERAIEEHPELKALTVGPWAIRAEVIIYIDGGPELRFEVGKGRLQVPLPKSSDG